MSHIDNEMALFEFDPYDGSTTFINESQALNSGHGSGNASHDSASVPADASQMQGNELEYDPIGKGKGVSKPMPIQIPSTSNVQDVFDIESMFLSSNHRDSHSSISNIPFSSSSSYFNARQLDSTEQASTSLGHDAAADLRESTFGKGKGKEKELPPTLPPLTFSPTEFGYGQVSWPSPAMSSETPGPSSYGSAYSSLTTETFVPMSPPAPPPLPLSEEPTISVAGVPMLRRMPSRRRSLSNISVNSTRSLAVRSISNIKVKLGPSVSPSNLARKLLSRRNGDATPQSPSPFTDESIAQLTNVGFSGNGFTSWRANLHQESLSVESNGEARSLPSSPAPFKGKIRSNSSPFPISAFDLVPVTSPDTFVSIPFLVRNYFDEILPTELRLKIFQSLVAVHKASHARAIREGHWSVAKASSSKNKWVGRDKGIRELVKLSRVSKSWQTLVFDGQLWADIDLRCFPTLPKSFILRLSEAGGGFIKTLDATGQVDILSGTLLDATDNIATFNGIARFKQLTAVNLQACSTLTTRSLHHLLIHSPSLEKLNVKGCRAVTNTTCDVLALYCPQLKSLDLGRCPNMDASGIRCLASAALSRKEHLRLTELRVSGLKYVDDNMMAILGKAAPSLEVLDMSYIRQLHNSAIDAFVACDPDDGEKLGVDTVVITASQAGRDRSNDGNYYCRRVTRLRHLNMSSCILLTDIACSNLAHSVPNLEFLEIAGIGEDFRDDGLVRLLETTPLIRRIDLEDASGISDKVIHAITPSSQEERDRRSEPQAGDALEHLVISYAARITDAALLALIDACTKLAVLEVDNTRIGTAVLREFVRCARESQAVGAKIVAVDCRGIGEHLVKELSPFTRPRMGWRTYDARKLKYIDGRDGEEELMKVAQGQDECDEKRVVLKTFYSWQTVDAVNAVREKRRKATSRRAANESNGSSTATDEELSRTGTRWWSPGGRRPGSGRRSPPTMVDLNNNDGCRIM